MHGGPGLPVGARRDTHKSVRLGIRQRTEQHRIRKREHDRRRAYADGDREDDGERGAWRPAHQAEREADVLPEDVHGSWELSAPKARRWNAS